MMPTFPASLKLFVLAALFAAAGPVCAGEDPWYSGQSTGFWGLGNSVGLRGKLPAVFGPGTSPEGLTAHRQFGGYRLSESFSVEGAQTSIGLNSPACGGDPLTGDRYRSCYGSAWSLSGVATLPFEVTGFSIYGRMGLHYWQNGAQEDPVNRHSLDDLGRVLGVGLSFELSKAITFHAETERYTEMSGNNLVTGSSGTGLNASVHSIGLSIKF